VPEADIADIPIGSKMFPANNYIKAAVRSSVINRIRDQYDSAFSVQVIKEPSPMPPGHIS